MKERAQKDESRGRILFSPDQQKDRAKERHGNDGSGKTQEEAVPQHEGHSPPGRAVRQCQSNHADKKQNNCKFHSFRKCAPDFHGGRRHEKTAEGRKYKAPEVAERVTVSAEKEHDGNAQQHQHGLTETVLHQPQRRGPDGENRQIDTHETAEGDKFRKGVPGESRRGTVKGSHIRIMPDAAERERGTVLQRIADELNGKGGDESPRTRKTRGDQQSPAFPEPAEQKKREQRRKKDVVDPDKTGKTVQYAEQGGVTRFRRHGKRKIQTPHDGQKTGRVAHGVESGVDADGVVKPVVELHQPGGKKKKRLHQTGVDLFIVKRDKGPDGVTQHGGAGSFPGHAQLA